MDVDGVMGVVCGGRASICVRGVGVGIERVEKDGDEDVKGRGDRCVCGEVESAGGLEGGFEDVDGIGT